MFVNQHCEPWGDYPSNKRWRPVKKIWAMNVEILFVNDKGARPGDKAGLLIS